MNMAKGKTKKRNQLPKRKQGVDAMPEYRTSSPKKPFKRGALKKASTLRKG